MDAKKNFAVSLVATAPSPATSGTSLVVTAGQGTRFPATPFNAVVCPVDADPVPENAEVVRVTNRSTDTLTITRATESSTARSVIVGDRIYAGPTALSFTDIEGNHAVGGVVSTIQPDDAAAAGSETTWARGDHKHAIVAAAPIGALGANAEGTGTSFARSDHTHAFSVQPPIPGYFPLGAPVSTATGVANTYYWVPFLIQDRTWTITGVEFKNGATTNGNVRCALYSYLLAKVADRTSDLAQAGSTNTRRQVPFDSTYTATYSGLFYALIWFSSATATAFMAPGIGPSAVCGTGTNATTTPTTPALAQLWSTPTPMIGLY